MTGTLTYVPHQTRPLFPCTCWKKVQESSRNEDGWGEFEHPRAPSLTRSTHLEFPWSTLVSAEIKEATDFRFIPLSYLFITILCPIYIYIYIYWYIYIILDAHLARCRWGSAPMAITAISSPQLSTFSPNIDKDTK